MRSMGQLLQLGFRLDLDRAPSLSAEWLHTNGYVTPSVTFDLAEESEGLLGCIEAFGTNIKTWEA
ncbi:hypothetical protein HDV05_002705, partial [Chytridiales sp. JEL 0842]